MSSKEEEPKKEEEVKEEKDESKKDDSKTDDTKEDEKSEETKKAEAKHKAKKDSEELTKRLPRLRLEEGQDLMPVETVQFRGPQELWVEWD